MKSNVHINMTTEERAKQFMPFAALKGYEEALRRVEAEVEGHYETIIETEKIYDTYEMEDLGGDR